MLNLSTPIEGDMDNQGSVELAACLAKVLGSVVVFKFKVHGFHWNVKGSDFKEYHAFFEEIYDDADDSIDPTAENIRKLGFDAPYLLSDFIELSAIDEGMRLKGSSVEMLNAVYLDNQTMISLWKEAFSCANACNEQGIANFVAERIDMHQKWNWQISATLDSGLESVGI